MYSGRKALLTSKHQKLDLIAPHFLKQAGLQVVELELDTDQLGTFTGEVPRTGTPLETAIAKAMLGMAQSNSPLGIASEGSIGPDPLVPFVVSDIEVIVFVDDERGIVISETHRSLEIAHAAHSTTTGEDLDEFLLKVGFPDQGLIVRSGAQGPALAKGIAELAELQTAIAAAIAQSGAAHIECDYRAMHSPTCRANIARAAELLAIRVSSTCPACATPGWGKLSYEKGLSCDGCGEFDAEAVRAEMLGCVSCDHTEPGKVIAQTLSPAKCQICNP